MPTNINICPYFQSVCPPMWDGASCVPPTLEGEDAVFPCMTLFNCKLYDVNCKLETRMKTENVESLLNFSQCQQKLFGWRCLGRKDKLQVPSSTDQLLLSSSAIRPWHGSGAGVWLGSRVGFLGHVHLCLYRGWGMRN